MHASVWPHPALVPVSRILRATCWANRFSWRLSTSTINAQRHYTPHPPSLSSIAEAMLGRAVKQFQPPPKREVASQPFASDSPTSTPKIEDALKKRPSSQSIGGFTNTTNRGTALRSLSPNARMASKPQKASLGRTISSADSNLASVLEKRDSFQDFQEEIAPSNSADKHKTPLFSSNDWLDDFPDDADIDLDLDDSPAPPVDFASYKYTPAPAKKSKPSPTLPKLPPPNRTHEITSSAQTWSSSSPSHKVTPPGAKRQYGGHSGFCDNELRSEDTLDANPRPAKRRTLPWVSKKSAEEAARKEAADVEDFTPLPKDTKNRSLPWNTSLSAIKDQQKSYKNQRKHLQRKADATADEMAAAATNSRKIMSSKTQLSAISLNEEQKKILELVTEKKKSVFFTGSAGTGKSVLMRSIIDMLKRKYAKDAERVCVTASTGLAACNIGGQTLHSFAGIGLGKEDVPTLVKKIRKNAKSKNRWIKCQILIIDEISMVDGDLFDKLESIARILKNNGRPFGGIQLIVTGDFFQLPPVPEHGKANVKFSFEAGTWSTVIDYTIGLTQVFRQKDPVFANMLNEMRMGTISDETVKLFKSLSRPIKENIATELFPTRNEVDNSNAMRLRNLVGKEYVYEASDGGTLTTRDMAQREKLLSNMMAPKSIKLKKGAQVMLIKNVDESLVNGSLGHVVGFMNEATFNLYDDDPEAFLDDDYLEEEGLSGREKKHREELKAKIEVSKGEGLQKLLPLVKFKLADGTSRDMLMQNEDWKVELPSGEVLASRKQLPLILAWALSIHKAQGQTLEFVKVDLGKVFEKGQAYVALSRATHQEGLQVMNFDKRKVMAHPTVIKFYRDLYGVDQVGKRTTSASTLVAKPDGISVKKDIKKEPEKKAVREVKREVKKQEFFEPDDEEEELLRMGGWG